MKEYLLSGSCINEKECCLNRNWGGERFFIKWNLGAWKRILHNLKRRKTFYKIP